MFFHQHLLAKLLQLANADPPSVNRDRFYALKQRLLAKYGQLVGVEIQEIRRECYGEGWWEGAENRVPCGPNCRRCGGTGIFSQRFWELERWEWCGHVFHRPRRELTRPYAVPHIVGRIEHSHDWFRAKHEATLWLYLLTGEFRLFAHAMRSGWLCFPALWPLSRLQKIVAVTAMKTRRQKCWCGKRFFTWGSGWQICKTCRRKQEEEWQELGSEIPF